MAHKPSAPKDQYYTVLVVPEKSSKVRKIILPSWILSGLLVGSAFFAMLAGMMLADYWYVMDQIDENKDLKIENRRLRQQVQIYDNKMATIEATMERIRTFSTRLKVITNIKDTDSLVKKLNDNLPDAHYNIGNDPLSSSSSGDVADTDLMQALDEKDPENIRIQQQQAELEKKFAEINYETLLTEQELQDLYELLAHQKDFLLALPTRKPAQGYFTSGFGIRKAPIGGVQKMHEGLDIANRVGTVIRAPANGVVQFARHRPGYGKTVIIDHGYGIETWYAHSHSILVKQGDKVKRGDRIATMGNTGRSTGPHLHYEVRVNDIPVDPLSYILEE